jgi:hypothetical protein
VPIGVSDAGGMSDLGLVSRASSVHTAVCNCTRDEERSFGVGNQVLISSHRKLLSSKAMVVNVCGNVGTKIPVGKIERGERKQTVYNAPRQRRSPRH